MCIFRLIVIMNKPFIVPVKRPKDNFSSEPLFLQLSNVPKTAAIKKPSHIKTPVTDKTLTPVKTPNLGITPDPVKTPVTSKTPAPIKTPTNIKKLAPVKKPPPIKTHSSVKKQAPVKSQARVKTQAPVKTHAHVKTQAPVKTPNAPVKTSEPAKSPDPTKTMAPVKTPAQVKTPATTVTAAKPKAVPKKTISPFLMFVRRERRHVDKMGLSKDESHKTLMKMWVEIDQMDKLKLESLHNQRKENYEMSLRVGEQKKNDLAEKSKADKKGKGKIYFFSFNWLELL